MTIREAVIGNLPLKILSIALATALWLLSKGSKEEVVDVSVPVLLRNVPSGLYVGAGAPVALNVSLAGPRLRLIGLRPRETVLELDLKNLAEGTATFGEMEKRLHVPVGVQVLKVSPETVVVRLVKSARSDARR